MRFSRRTFSLAAAIAPFIVPAAGHGQATASSSHDFEPASDRLHGMLEFVPQTAVLADLFGFIWLDIERHLASVRERIDAASEEFIEDEAAYMSLYAAGSPLIDQVTNLEIAAGYTLSTVRQIVEFGTPPEVGMVMRLDMPVESLIPFWESNGYELIEREFGSFWSLDEEAGLDFEHPTQRIMLARMNNVAILEGDLIVYAATSRLLGEVMSLVPGETFTVNKKLEGLVAARPHAATPRLLGESMSAVSGETLSMNKDLEGRVAALPEDATSAWLVDSGVLDFQSAVLPQLIQDDGPFEEVEAMMAESDDAVGAMPIVTSLLLGAGEGGFRHDEVHNPDSREFMVLQTSRVNMAEQAARVIDWRIQNFHNLETGEPYSSLLAGTEFEVIDGQTLRLSRPMAVPRTVLPRMIIARDVLPFTFRWGQ